MSRKELNHVGNDRFGRPCFLDADGNAYVDTDYQRNPRTSIRTKYPAKDWWFGEPDRPVDTDGIEFVGDEIFVLVRWPDVQRLMEVPGFQEKCTLVMPDAVTGEPDSAYLVPVGFGGVKATPGDMYRELGFPEDPEDLDNPGNLTDYVGIDYLPVGDRPSSGRKSA